MMLNGEKKARHDIFSECVALWGREIVGLEAQRPEGVPVVAAHDRARRCLAGGGSARHGRPAGPGHLDAAFTWIILKISSIQ